MDRPDAAPRTASVVMPRADPVLAALGLLAVLVVAFYGLQLAGRATQVIVCWLAMAGVHIMYAVTARRVSRLPGAIGATRRLWRACAVVGTIYLYGDATQLISVAQDPVAPASATGTDAQTACVIAGTVLLLIVMLSSPLGIESRRERARFWLDTATVMAAAATFGFYAIALPDAEAPATWLLDAAGTVLSGPGVFLVGVFAVIKLILGGQPPFTRAAGIACALAAGLEGALQALPATFQPSKELAVVLGGNILASGLLVVGARVQQLQMQADPRQQRRRERPAYSVLPYGAIGVTYTLLVYVLATQGLDGHAWVVVGGAILSTTLVVGRQLAAFRHIAELLAERDALGAQLTHQAFHDSLTGLPNRALLRDRLTAALRAEADIAVVLIDLDDFKPVNDRYGHAAGDELLTQVGAWLSGHVRAGDTVARLGGDEFAVLLTDVPADERDTVGERLSALLRRDTTIKGAIVEVRASVGVAFAAARSTTPDDLLHEADLAMYAAKRHHKVAAN